MTKITWIANLVKMIKSLTVKKKPTMTMWIVLVRRSITRLKKRIQALYVSDKDSGREEMFMLMTFLQKLTIFFSDIIKWKRSK